MRGFSLPRFGSRSTAVPIRHPQRENEGYSKCTVSDGKRQQLRLVVCADHQRGIRALRAVPKVAMALGASPGRGGLGFALIRGERPRCDTSAMGLDDRHHRDSRHLSAAIAASFAATA
jgi:hypothetical protein